MKTPFLIILHLFFCHLSRGQKDSAKYKWPFYGERVPPYVALTGAYEGLTINNFQAGIAFNAVNAVVTPAIGAMVGGGLFYKQSAASKKIYSYEAELGFYGGLALGANYNYNVTSSNTISGFKPFIGIAAYNVQVFYGYSFYNSKSDVNKDLRHNRITIRYVLPIVKT